MGTIKLGDLDLSGRIDDERYETELAALQKQLGKVLQAYFFQGHRAVIAVEGMDAAGKGGLIRRVTWALDPRGVRVWPIGAPTAEEKGQHWLQRFWTKLPGKGQIVIFDRSWYGRVLVERVEGFAEKKAWKRAYDEINTFEQQLVDDGIRLAKLYLHVSADEQAKRLKERLDTPSKRWKLTFEDFRNREKAGEYVEAAEDMLSKADAVPWKVVAGDHKKWARIEAMRHLVGVLSAGVDLTPPEVDPKLLALAEQALG